MVMAMRRRRKRRKRRRRWKRRRPKWEIPAMAVHPSLQGGGLASTLLGRVFEEIKTRAAAAAAASPPRQSHAQL